MNVTGVSKTSKEGKECSLSGDQGGHQSMSGLFQKLLYRGKSLQERGQEYPRKSSVASLRLPELCFFGFCLCLNCYLSPLQSCIIPGSLQSEVSQVKFGCRLFPCQDTLTNSSLDHVKKCKTQGGAFDLFSSAFLKRRTTPGHFFRQSQQPSPLDHKLITDFMTSRCIMNLRKQRGRLLSGKWQLQTTLGQYNRKMILCENTAFSVMSFVPGKGIYRVAGLIVEPIWREW